MLEAIAFPHCVESPNAGDLTRGHSFPKGVVPTTQRKRTDGQFTTRNGRWALTPQTESCSGCSLLCLSFTAGSAVWLGGDVFIPACKLVARSSVGYSLIWHFQDAGAISICSNATAMPELPIGRAFSTLTTLPRTGIVTFSASRGSSNSTSIPTTMSASR